MGRNRSKVLEEGQEYKIYQHFNGMIAVCTRCNRVIPGAEGAIYSVVETRIQQHRKYCVANRSDEDNA